MFYRTVCCFPFSVLVLVNCNCRKASRTRNENSTLLEKDGGKCLRSKAQTTKPRYFGCTIQEKNLNACVLCVPEIIQILQSLTTQCQDEFRNLSGCVIKILTGGRILQISIAWCQIEAEIRSFPTMYGKGGGICGKNWRNKGFRPKVMPKTRFF